MKQLYKVLSFLLLSGIVLTGCDELVSKLENVKDSTIKAVKAGETETGDTVRVQGTYVDANAVYLVDDASKLLINTPMDEESYLRLDPVSAETYTNGVETGQIIELKGVVVEFDSEEDKMNAEHLGQAYVRGIRVIEFPKVIGKTDVDLTYITPGISLCELNPVLCEKIGETLKADEYALLYSGGCNAANNHSRYWNDLKFMYLTLVNVYDYDPDHIKVVYAGGTAADSEMPVDYAATSTGLQNAMNELQADIDFTDKLFVFTTNHGGGYATSDSKNHGGLSDSDGDEFDAYGYDETMCRYNSNLLSDDTFAALIDNINAAQMIFVLEPCFSGGFIRDLSGENRIIMSAANSFQFSYARTGGAYDEFSYHFTSAVNGNDPDGNTIDADADNDGRVSMLEAFNYAITNDTKSENPQYEDDGDGLSTSTPSAGGGGDGAFGSNITL
ncbi:C13 family peptidase [Saccharicrinis sp. FJH54]|uniref:C13 family peptidase n=1 Tax=Saccharicrinis sp. FJH54 TaxID=3344665 RepID=UPI0035D4184A